LIERRIMRMTSGAMCGAGVLLAAAVAVRAQQTKPAAQPQPLVPVAASSLAESPDAYLGQNVSVVGAVEHSLSPTAFSIDQDRTRLTGREVLVLAPRLNAPVELNAYVTVLGEVVRFEPAAIAGRMAIDLPPDVAEKYRGRPAILATVVLNAAFVDLARQPLPPLTPDEAAYDAVMKRVGTSFSTLRQAVGGSDGKAVEVQAAVLEQAFTETAAFWKGRGKADAMQWAGEGRTHAGAIAGAAARGDWDAVKASTASLGQACQSCHGSYRDRLGDGTYRIKAAGW
jgi:hypothetical protein